MRDEAVLSSYPAALRRRCLRHIYGRTLRRVPLLRRVSDRFLDALLAAARVELFMPKVNYIRQTRARLGCV